jgi:hypothetical protein
MQMAGAGAEDGDHPERRRVPAGAHGEEKSSFAVNTEGYIRTIR